MLVFSPNAISDAPHNLAATIDLPKGHEPRVMRALLAPFPSVSVIEVGAVLTQVRDLVGQMAAAILAATSVAVLAGIAVLVGAIAAAREARTYDSVILRTLGATRAQVLASQAIEYAVLSAALAALALGRAWQSCQTLPDSSYGRRVQATYANIRAQNVSHISQAKYISTYNMARSSYSCLQRIVPSKSKLQ